MTPEPTPVPWQTPRIRDYGTLENMTRSHVFFAEGSSVHRVMDFSGSTPGGGTQPGSGSHPATGTGHTTPDQSGVSPETATGNTSPTASHPDTGGVKDVSATGGGTPGSSGSSPGGSLGAGPDTLASSGGGSGGKLPFTGADLALEATAGAGAVGAGVVARRLLRKRRSA